MAIVPKKIIYDVAIKSTSHTRSYKKPPEVFTNDLHSVQFRFNLLDVEAAELNEGAAVSTIEITTRDGSFFQYVGETSLDGTTIVYDMKEAEGNHAGLAKIQLILKLGISEFASDEYEFNIKNGLRDRVPVQIYVQNWETLTTQANAYLTQMAQDIEDFDVALNNGVLATNIAAKLTELSTTFAPDLVAVKQQLSQINTDYQSAAANLTVDSEVILARNSVSKNKSYTSLDSRIEETEGDVDANVSNFVQNGNFSNGVTGWSAGASTITASNNTLFVTGNGVDYNPKAKQILSDLNGKKVYLRARARVMGSGCNIMFLRTYDVAVSAQISNPVAEQWYDLIAYGNFVASSDISVNHRYVDAISADGKVMEVQFVTALDLTTSFGAGKEPTLAQLTDLLSRFGNGWFDGRGNLYQSRQEISKRLALEGSIATVDGRVTTVDGRVTNEMGKTIQTLATVSATDQTYSDANNVPNNRIVRYTIVGCPNTPSGKMGTLLSFAYSAGVDIGGRVQFFVDDTGNSYSRMYWSGTWRTWVTNGGDPLVKQLGTVTAIESPYYDANSILTNRIVRYGGVGLNTPSSTGTLVCFVPDSAQINGTSQIFISSAGDFYFRHHWNSWFAWKKITTDGSANSIDSRDYYASFSMFESIGVIGDSYASGAFGNTPEAIAAVDHYNKSWPQMLARRNGVSVTNYTKGGLSTRSWLTEANYGLPKLLTDSPKDIYILALIRNDYNIEDRGETGYKGSITDITGHVNFADYPDSFYGNYGKIIEQIKIHSPNAKLILMTGDYTSSNILGTAYNVAAVEIANQYGIPTMVQLEESYFSSSFYRSGWPAGGHPGAMQYGGMELAIERMFQKAVSNNKLYFAY